MSHILNNLIIFNVPQTACNAAMIPLDYLMFEGANLGSNQDENTQVANKKTLFMLLKLTPWRWSPVPHSMGKAVKVNGKRQGVMCRIIKVGHLYRFRFQGSSKSASYLCQNQTPIQSLHICWKFNINSSRIFYSSPSQRSKEAYHKNANCYKNGIIAMSHEQDLCNLIAYEFENGYSPSSISFHVCAIGFLYGA